MSMDHGAAAMRRGSYDDGAALRPHLRSLAQRRRSAPSLALGRALGMPWYAIREEAPCWVAEQCPFVLGLSSENAELVLDQCVQVTEGLRTRERHLFLFSDVLVMAKLKSNASYRLKHKVSLEELWLWGFEEEEEEEEGGGDVDLRSSLVLAWPLAFCMVTFCSSEVKERWLDTLHRKINEAKERAGCTSPAPSILMKVLSGSITTKTLTGGGMEPSIEIPLDGDGKIPALSRQLCNTEVQALQPIENGGNSKWSILRRLRRSPTLPSMPSRPDTDPKTQLFGRRLSKICPEEGTLPKPITDMLVLLWKKGPSTEGVFRKACNSKNLKAYREQVNSGAEVNMDDLPVVLLVGLLKSFLKELPGSLLVSKMYNTWMVALATEDSHQRLSNVQSVVDMLPGHNILLLQHLLCVLNHITEHVDANKMDAKNLAVCIAPTLLQLDSTPLDVHTVEKVTELTQFLIKHCCEIFGEQILGLLGDPDEDNLDSISSQQHDSAYDSTDPDAEGDPGGSSSSSSTGTGTSQGEQQGGSSPSLLSKCSSESTAIASCSSTAIFHTFTQRPFNRRCSEPIIFPSAQMPTSDDSFLLLSARSAEARRPVLSLPKLSGSLNTEQQAAFTAGGGGDPSKDCSCSSTCSLESTASNQSEGSSGGVFTSSSPLASPSCPRRALSACRHAFPPLSAKPKAPELLLLKTDQTEVVKRRSQSMRSDSKAPLRTKSLGAFAFARGSLKKGGGGDAQKESTFPCGTLQEDSQSEVESPAAAERLPRQRPLSAVEVFQQVDSRLLCRPPPYEQAVQSAAQPAPPHYYRSMTVQDARKLSRRSRPASMNDNFLSTSPVSQYAEHCAQGAEGVDTESVVATEGVAKGAEQCPQFRHRAMSASVSRANHETVSRRCSQPVFEEYSYAKESYV